MRRSCRRPRGRGGLAWVGVWGRKWGKWGSRCKAALPAPPRPAPARGCGPLRAPVATAPPLGRTLLPSGPSSSSRPSCGCRAAYESAMSAPLACAPASLAPPPPLCASAAFTSGAGVCEARGAPRGAAPAAARAARDAARAALSAAAAAASALSPATRTPGAQDGRAGGKHNRRAQPCRWHRHSLPRAQQRRVRKARPPPPAHQGWPAA
jgi:hypothetical protein